MFVKKQILVYNSVMKLFNRNKKVEDKNLKKNKSNIALCLGGGGARGFAHIGVIKAFEEAQIEFNLVIGTSAGSIVGALYSAGVSSGEMINYSRSVNLKDVHNGLLILPNDAGKIGRLVTNLIGDAYIEDLKRKFVAVAVDIVEGKQCIIDKGKVGIAVSASACVPIFFKPVVVGQKHLVDGGLLNNIPADVARMLGANFVVTSDINPTRGGGRSGLGIMDVAKATFNIMSANSSINGLLNSDIIIAPDLSEFKATDKTGYEEMINIGYTETKKKIDEIKRLFVNN